jgi:hypothetical protein
MYRILSFSLILLLISCKINNNAKESKETESFMSFREKFYSDTTFQKDRILFPLPGINTDDMEIGDSIYFWEKDKWKFLSDFSIAEGIKKETAKSDTSILEKMYLQDSGFIVNTEFVLKMDKWYLSRLDISNL